MSGVIKGVGKVFKKAVSGASKILPVALAAGAVLFTAGNAMGLTSSWGDAVGSVVDKLGVGSGLSNIITSAVTNAGYGAVAGAATSGLAGGSIMQGTQYGAAGGAIVGGVKGAYENLTSPATAATGMDAPSSAKGAGAVQSAPAPSNVSGGGNGSILSNGVSMQGSDAIAGGVGDDPIITGAAPSSAGSAAASNPGILDKGGWLERNGTMAGNVLLGVGKGLAGADGEAQAKALQQRAEIVRQNYGSPRVGLLTAGTQTTNTVVDQGAPRMSPGQRFSPAAYGAAGQGQYVYDPSTGRYTFVQS